MDSKIEVFGVVFFSKRPDYRAARGRWRTENWYTTKLRRKSRSVSVGTHSVPRWSMRANTGYNRPHPFLLESNLYNVPRFSFCDNRSVLYVPLLFSSINGCIIKDKEYAKNRFILYRVGQEVNTCTLFFFSWCLCACFGVCFLPSSDVICFIKLSWMSSISCTVVRRETKHPVGAVLEQYGNGARGWRMGHARRVSGNQWPVSRYVKQYTCINYN